MHFHQLADDSLLGHNLSGLQSLAPFAVSCSAFGSVDALLGRAHVTFSAPRHRPTGRSVWCRANGSQCELFGGQEFAGWYQLSLFRVSGTLVLPCRPIDVPGRLHESKLLH
jgi:hypothetical protein